MWSVFNTCAAYCLPSFQFCQCLTRVLNLSFSSSGFLKWTLNFNGSWCNAGGNSISNKSNQFDLYGYICQHSKPVSFSNEDADNLMSLLEKSLFFVVVHFPQTLRGFVHFCKSPSEDVISASDETLLRVCLLLDEQFCVLQMSALSSLTSLTSRLLDAGKRLWQEVWLIEHSMRQGYNLPSLWAQGLAFILLQDSEEIMLLRKDT